MWLINIYNEQHLIEPPARRATVRGALTKSIGDVVSPQFPIHQLYGRGQAGGGRGNGFAGRAE